MFELLINLLLFILGVIVTAFVVVYLGEKHGWLD